MTMQSKKQIENQSQTEYMQNNKSQIVCEEAEQKKQHHLFFLFSAGSIGA